MTTNELKQTCRKKGISFIPHHECGLCGQPTGWYLFERWPPYEVAYSSACGCCDSEARCSTWQDVLDWVCDEDGTLRPEYEYLKPDPADHKTKLYVSRDGDGKLLLHFAYPHWGDNHDFRSPNQVELNPLLFPEVKPGRRVEYIAGEVFDTIR